MPRYAELTPDELEAAWRERPVAYCALGALEWHGPHLPLGLDGLVAERFAERLAERAGGVLLPSIWLPMTTLPHRMSLSVQTEVARGIWRDLLAGLAGGGAQVVCLITGHYAQGHELELYGAALKAMRDHPSLRVLAASPLELLGNERLLDHAGRWETAQLLTARPDLVHLDRFPGMCGPAEVAVLGEDPRTASAEEGEALTRQALEVWAGWIERLLRDFDPAALGRLYAQLGAGYSDYVRRYFKGSWEQAIQAWWAEKTGSV